MSKFVPFTDCVYAILAVAADGTQSRIGRYHSKNDHDRFRKNYGRLTAKARTRLFRENMCWLPQGSVTRVMEVAADSAVDFRFVKLTLSESR